ncbi:MAG: hypothetical protein ACE5HI_12770 [bacterium]
MKHDRNKVALASAIVGVEFMARWILHPKRWRNLFCALGHIADAFELCWKIRAGIPEGTRCGYPEAAEEVELATSSPTFTGRWYEFEDPYLETVWKARNARHDSFEDTIPSDHIFLAFGRLFFEIESALGYRLERCVPKKVWQTILNKPYAVDIIEHIICKCFAPARQKYVYLSCPICTRQGFDSYEDYCRSCLHQEDTFMCACCHKADFSRNQMRWLLTLDAENTKKVCRSCFAKLAKRREKELLSKPLKLGADGQSIQPFVNCCECNKKCFDITKSRCLLCGVRNELWAEQQMEKHDLGWCADCGKLLSLRQSIRRLRVEDTAYCKNCTATWPWCWLCGEPCHPDDGVKTKDGIFYCGQCARREVRRCSRCRYYYSVDMVFDELELFECNDCQEIIAAPFLCHECLLQIHNSHETVDEAIDSTLNIVIPLTRKWGGETRKLSKQLRFVLKEYVGGLRASDCLPNDYIDRAIKRAIHELGL